ncbi:MAG: Ribonuclease III [uncultured Thermomicrobiales bacterium]|uniref:Ribonuclease 3 n=1 Tax=uncultured Thermomicrobiales bacterium TaxID=1645740 RepID=A0A6J4VP70_9BACT|nr:MAG: Ribonuclease III [uncultured Thermomicrobiales bacterium]
MIRRSSARSRSKSSIPAPARFRLPDPAREHELATRIGVTFRDPLVLRLALTHRSVLSDWLTVPQLDATRQSNERLEFLGDALLGAIVAEHLFTSDPDADEGTLTSRRVAIVRAETLVRWARGLDLASFLYMGIGERVTEGVRDRMLAGAFEALVGAVHVDQGRDAAARFVLGFLARDRIALLADEVSLNPKGRLQEVLQDQARAAPVYLTLEEEGPDHARMFTVAVTIENKEYGVGKGISKRAAQQEAARQALHALEEGGAGSPDAGSPGALPGHDPSNEPRVQRTARDDEGDPGLNGRREG